MGYLFLTGFLTSAIVGGVAGTYVDKYGRRLGCVVFCVLEVNTIRIYTIHTIRSK